MTVRRLALGGSVSRPKKNCSASPRRRRTTVVGRAATSGEGGAPGRNHDRGPELHGDDEAQARPGGQAARAENASVLVGASMHGLLCPSGVRRVASGRARLRGSRRGGRAPRKKSHAQRRRQRCLARRGRSARRGRDGRRVLSGAIRRLHAACALLPRDRRQRRCSCLPRRRSLPRRAVPTSVDASTSWPLPF